MSEEPEMTHAGPGVTYVLNAIGAHEPVYAPPGHMFVATCLPRDEAMEVARLAARLDARPRAEVAAERGTHPRFYVDAEKLEMAPDVLGLANQAISNARAHAERHLREALSVRTWLVTIETEQMERVVAPGTIVRGGPVDAVWRVLAATRLGVEGVEGECTCVAGLADGIHAEECLAGKRVLIPSSAFLVDLEPVDPHNVGPLQRVCQLPAATREISPALAAEWRERTACGEQAIG